MTTARDLAGDETNEPESKSGVRVHPLIDAMSRAPLDPISDEENEILDEIVRTTDHWLTHEEFLAEVGVGHDP